MVCDGEIDRATAQQAFATDWIAAYQRYYGEQKRRRKPEAAPLPSQ
jgi:hypothetical protein